MSTVCDPDDFTTLDDGILPLVTAFEAIPGIEITGACTGHPGLCPGDAGWWISWRLTSADHNLPVSYAGAHPAGVLNTERLLEHAGSYHSSVQRDVLVRPLGRLYPENTPGTCLGFIISGNHDHGDWELLSPDTYLRALQDHWAEADYPAIAWPAAPRLSGTGQQ
ncbi:hypothetical protein [Streptomyces erythrochromogenes]|uniref:hypothetical protein n=1 Tax=Streptomyces erythrochromogenes TaxID=285574 RepID=UPI0038661280|nr:hypothetical protein OG489_00280 [Streptomyces erythrochromogenes]WSR88312.1 hypothetical protein OG489_39680 [Streptomyces erythrochromogenes]